MDINKASSVKSKAKVMHVQFQGHITKANTKAKADGATEGLDESQQNKILYFFVVLFLIFLDADF